MRYLKPFMLIDASGFWDYRHLALKENYLCEEDEDLSDSTDYIHAIHQYIRSLPPSDPLKVSSGLHFAFLCADTNLLCDLLIYARKFPRVGQILTHKLLYQIQNNGVDLFNKAVCTLTDESDMEIIIAFLCEMFYPVLDKTDFDHAVGLLIFDNAAQHIQLKFQNVLSDTTLAGLFNRLGALYADEKNEKAAHYYELASDYALKANQSQSSNQTLYNYLIAQYKKATLEFEQSHFEMSFEILEKALMTLSDAEHDSENISLLSVESSIAVLASVCQTKLENIPNGLIFAEIGAQKSMLVYRSLGDTDSLINLTKSLMNLLNFSFLSDHPSESMIEYIDEILSFSDEIYRQTRHVQWLKNIAHYQHQRIDIKFDEKTALNCIATYETLIKNFDEENLLHSLYLVNFKLGTYYYKNHQHKECYSILSVAIEQAEIYLNQNSKVDDETLTQIAEMNRQMGTLCYELDEIQTAIQYASRSVQLNSIIFEASEQKTFENMQNYALSLGCLGENYAKLGDFIVSRNLFLKQLSLIEALYNFEHRAEDLEKLLNCLKNLYVVYNLSGDEDTAWTYRRKAEQLMSTNNPEHSGN